MVWRDGWILGWNHAGDLDGECAGLDDLALDVRIQRQAARPIETYTPVYNNGAFVGLEHEAIFYDPEAFVAPLHVTMRFNRHAGLDNPTRRYTYIECLSNLRNVDGRPSQLTASDPRFIDYYGRPWAKNWEKYFEVGWDKPQDDLPANVLDLLDRLDGKK